ncbi:hypothetical protein AB0P15_32195 [Streptomyces sp. NPDC087917]|uniref:hypothetical protein n=1 Tax=unclassified Streptomyces TaxID=2593676 RepID=UPI00342414B4
MIRPLRTLTTAAALSLLTFQLTGCGASSTFERCIPPEATAAGGSELAGTYRGKHDADGVSLTLSLTPGHNGGDLTVENWPTGDYYRAELGATFKGSGTWEIDTPSNPKDHPLVHLYFTQPHDWLSGDTVDRLSVAMDSTGTVLYENSDPDTCPDFRLDLTKTS